MTKTAEKKKIETFWIGDSTLKFWDRVFLKCIDDIDQTVEGAAEMADAAVQARKLRLK